ncbi:FK506-binding protein 3-like [Lolium rigidum]|uniref:FK506-binding protein 3-like n=1 Tax=Lolium rigidum TaxID=89674 RepID=UPI001F5C542D|nr:FK506-binding protein 3-like [Lolium rigidum]
MVPGARISGSVSHTACSRAGRARPGKGTAVPGSVSHTASSRAGRARPGTGAAVPGARISGSVSHTASSGAGRARPGKRAAAAAATTSTSTYPAARHSDGLEIQEDVAPSSQRDASNMIKKGRRAVGPNKRGFHPFSMKVLEMAGHKGSTTYDKAPKRKRAAADCDYVNDKAIEETRDLKVQKKIKTNPSEAHTDQQCRKRKHTHSDAKGLAEQSTKKRKGNKKRDKNSSNMNMHSDLLVSEKVPLNSSEEMEVNKDRIISQTLVVGKGRKALSGKVVSIRYTGKLLDGTVFGHSTADCPLVFKLGDGKVIEGVDVGIVGMRVGERRKLTIPPSLGFGGIKMGDIPANSTLEIDIQLTRVVN